MKNFLYTFLLLLVLIIQSFSLLTSTKANSLGEGYLFFERMKVSTATEMTGMFTPSSDFSGTDPISLKIIFPEAAAGTWCKVNASTLTIAGESSSPVDQGSWSIDAALPGTLVATCYQGSGGSTDYIEVTGITALTSGTSYGFTISANETNFVTGANSGSNLISYQLIEGTKVETLSFSANLLADDQVVVTATVEDAETITCSILESNVNLGTLFRGGAYITGDNQLTTDSTMGFYWAVYGEGNGSNAGLYNSSGAGYLLPSAGVEGEVNLLTGEGFGMLASSTEGYVPVKYTLATLGVFGSIGFGVDNASVFLYADVPTSTVTTSITYGAKASVSALEGNYQETLTYICGGYVGATVESESIEASAFLIDNPPCDGATSITDSRDGQTYDLVAIGDQCWMAENLAYLPDVMGPGTGSDIHPYYYVYDYDGTDVQAAKATDNYQNYGVLYNWRAATNGQAEEGVQGICPENSYLPKEADWIELSDYIIAETDATSSTVARWLKSCRQDSGDFCGECESEEICPISTHPRWDYHNTLYGINALGFTALPGGYRYAFGVFGGRGSGSYFWSSSFDSDLPLQVSLNTMNSNVNIGTTSKLDGLSVRCLKN